MKKNPNWSTGEIILLSDASKTDRELSLALGRTEAAIRGKRQRLGWAEKRTKFQYDPAEYMGESVVTQVGCDAQGPAEKHKKFHEQSEVERREQWATYSSTHAVPGGCVAPGTVDPLKEAAKQVPAEFGSIPLAVFDGDAWTKIGLVADTHLCCREERLDALHAQYDLFVREGVENVFHGGNIVDGYVPRINGGSVFESSVDGQAMYCAKNYPQRAGITTHFITGNDHEGWWQKEGFNFGAYLQMVCEKLGRQDMKYIGHIEADIVLTAGDFKQIMKIQHPGGGSAYARSYKGQKIVEAFQGGEKPAILAIGHYHVSGYSFDRNVHIIGLPGFQDQTIFGRTKHLRYEIGGVILELKMSSVTGAITRVRPEFNMFFDRGFYKKFIPSDEILRGEPTIIKTGHWKS